MGKMAFKVFISCFDQILFIPTCNDGIHKILAEFEIRPDRQRTTELAALEHLKNQCYHFLSVAIYPIHFKFVGIEDMHNIYEEFEFWPDRTTDYGVICP